MNWFLVIMAILGLIMGIAPGVIADKIKECAEAPGYNARETARNSINVWLWIFGVVIWVMSGLFVGQMSYLGKEVDKELESRIEALEQRISQTDTTTVNIQKGYYGED